MDEVIRSYENYREEDRLTTNNARRIEFMTTVRMLGAHLPPRARLLDCAAGTGVYALHYAEQGHDVTALDLTPRHIEVLRAALKDKPFSMETDVCDATDLSRFADASFDAVLCMGPLYHLPDAAPRAKCLSECTRVLRPGGLLAVAYISRFFILLHSALNNPTAVNPLTEKLLSNGALYANDPGNTWTDTYFATPQDMEEALAGAGLRVIDHFAADGLSPLLHGQVDALSPEAFAAWCDCHYRTCREPSLLGYSNHGMVIGQKPG